MGTQIKSGCIFADLFVARHPPTCRFIELLPASQVQWEQAGRLPLQAFEQAVALVSKLFLLKAGGSCPRWDCVKFL